MYLCTINKFKCNKNPCIVLVCRVTKCISFFIIMLPGSSGQQQVPVCLFVQLSTGSMCIYSILSYNPLTVSTLLI